MLVASQDFVESVLVRTILPKNNPPTIVHDKVLNLIQVSARTGQRQEKLSAREPPAQWRARGHRACPRLHFSFRGVSVVCWWDVLWGGRLANCVLCCGVGRADVVKKKKERKKSGKECLFSGCQVGRLTGELWLPAVSPCSPSVLG